MSENLMTSNVYSLHGKVVIVGSCLKQVSPAGYEKAAADADGVYSLCLEETHLNMAITKLSAVLGTGQVTALRFVTVDRSPHCTQMHYIRHEIERVLPKHVPIEDYVVVDGQLIHVSAEAIERSKTLAALSAETVPEISDFSK